MTSFAFANLRMSADLGFSDRVYGLGVGMFYISYVLFEIPGDIVVERWSARKWIARIMVSWGAVTILTAFVGNAKQFYAARFFRKCWSKHTAGRITSLASLTSPFDQQILRRPVFVPSPRVDQCRFDRQRGESVAIVTGASKIPQSVGDAAMRF